MNRVKKAYWALRQMGPRVVTMRAGVYLRSLLGSTRREFVPRPWGSIELNEICRPGTPTDSAGYANFKRQQDIEFLFPLGRPPQPPTWLSDGPTQRQPEFAERLRLLAADRPVYCFHTPSPAAIDWNANPISKTRSFGDRIWCDIPDFDPAQGDIRLFWDPARAAWAIDLARAHARGIAPGAGRLYWRWFDSWASACPPWQGPHWKCGQESFVRLLAITIGFWSLADDPATTSDRWSQLAKLAWATGYRIDHHIDYARSQKNNHALSEACGLMLIGHLFPELREADRWFQRGRQVFSEELARQIYSDGSYLQHSMNYHRVMLQVSVMAALLAKWHRQPLDDSIIRHISAAEEFLFQMLDSNSGQAPLYGNNDGAWVLPLDECDYSDFRGTVQAAHFLTTGKRRFDRGPWDENLLWLFGIAALEAPQEPPQQPKSTAFRDGGYFTLRGDNSWAMIRCHTYRDRPGHYDPLHFDLWHQGQNVLRDCGTYQYYPSEGRTMEDYFQLSAAHNTIEIDRHLPVERVSRFLFFPWPHATLNRFEADQSAVQIFEGESSDYDRPPWRVLHRRSIVALQSDVWLIIDDLLGAGQHTATMRWHLADAPVTFDKTTNIANLTLPTGDWCLNTSCNSNRSWDRLEIIRGREQPGPIQGFTSPYYGERIPIPVLEGEITTELPLRLLTVAAPGKISRWESNHQSANVESLKIHAAGQAWQLELAPLDRRSSQTVIGISRLEREVNDRKTESNSTMNSPAVSALGH